MKNVFVHLRRDSVRAHEEVTIFVVLIPIVEWFVYEVIAFVAIVLLDVIEFEDRPSIDEFRLLFHSSIDAKN